MPAAAAAEVQPFGMSAREVLAALNSEPRHGLADEQLPSLRAKYGWNELTKAAAEPAWKKLLRQFNELVIWILAVAALTSGLLGDRTDAIVILAIVLLNGMFGFLQERRAEQAFAELEKLAAPMAKVTRHGKRILIPARELLPGDELELHEGDLVPADARLVDAYGLQTQEASLTGESVPVDKIADLLLAADTPLGDRRNMVYLGTAVTAGRATAVVTVIGMRTELGRIAELLQQATSEPTPLQRRINRLGRTLVAICLALIALTFGVQLARGGQILEVFLLAVSLAVAAIPEGLPAVVTVALAIGVRKMARRKALIRRLPSVETLGSVSVICTDKTGTLTRNQMMVREMLAGAQRFRVTGDGYQPAGDFLESGSSGWQAVNPADSPDLTMALLIGARCNHARLLPPAPGGDGPGWRVAGDPTEGALLVAAMKARVDIDPTGYDTIDETPFDSDRKYMSITLRAPDGTVTMYRKGAIEAVLPGCARERWRGATRALSEQQRAEITRLNAEFASGGLRVLALAYQDLAPAELDTTGEGTPIFAGLVAMIDPPREEVKQSVERCWQAGIRPVMITGDHPATALTIARELGIAPEGSVVLSGREIDLLSDVALSERSADVAVYARVTAEHKLRIVRALKRRQEVVAMTGDGANDAPAIKEADIGIAMGVSGTDVTRQSADLVLLDDNFATIVAAVEQGRGILDNIQKFLHYLLSGNAAELAVMFAATAIGWPFPLLATQLLWINLVTDGLPALALGFEPVEESVMRRPPRPLNHALLDRQRAVLILFHALLIAAAALVAFAVTYGGQTSRLANARAVVFATLAFSQIAFALSCRSDIEPWVSRRTGSNPWLLAAVAASAVMQVAVMSIPTFKRWFDVNATLTTADWTRITLFSLAPFVIIETAKLARKALISIDSDDSAARNPVIRALFITLAAVCLLLGIIGLIAPIIPGTLFLALAVLLLARGSERWRRWLHNRSWYVSLRDKWRGRRG
jgi:Ca2+-transporting ATPase